MQTSTAVILPTGFFTGPTWNHLIHLDTDSRPVLYGHHRGVMGHSSGGSNADELTTGKPAWGNNETRVGH